MPNLTQLVFDHTASTYDHDRAKLVPAFDRIYARAIELIPAKAKTIVDLDISYHHANYVTQPLPQSVCSIVSSLSIHHLDDADKQALYRKAHEALKPNGVFVNADHIAGPTPEMEVIYYQRWLAEVRALGATEQQVADSLYRQKEDRRSPIGPQLQWLREAGFANADCWFKESSFAVLTGTRQ